MEHKIEKAKKMEAELEMAQCEVQTLKKLLQGKDHLVIQKSRALDVAKVWTFRNRLKIGDNLLNFYFCFYLLIYLGTDGVWICLFL